MSFASVLPSVLVGRIFTRWSRLIGAACVATVSGFAEVPAITGPDSIELFVSPAAGDRQDGTREAPFATLEQARDEIRRLRREGLSSSHGVTVTLRGGFYPRKSTFALTEEDSGDAAAPIVYRTAQSEVATLVGGNRFVLADSMRVEDPEVLERLPEVARGRVRVIDLRAAGIDDFGSLPLLGAGMGFLEKKTAYRRGAPAPELFFEGKPLTLARWPNSGYAETGEVAEVGDIIRAWMDDAKGGKAMDFDYVPPGDRRDPPQGFAFAVSGVDLRRWETADDLRLHGYWYYNWSDQSVEVASIDPEAGLIRSRQPSAYGIRAGQRFYAYNLLEELDEPGEWYLDRKAGLLFLWAPTDELDAELTLSLLEGPLVEVKAASYVRFEGIRFVGTRSQGLVVRDGTSVEIRDCLVTQTARTGIHLQEGSHHRVMGCEVAYSGTKGIIATGGDRERLLPSGHRLEGNYIHDFARLEKTYNPGVELDGVGQYVGHNEICHSPHVAILFSGNNHLIELNHIYDVVREADDAAAIYAGRKWTARGTVIRFNLLRDVVGFLDGTHAASCIYLDDGFSGTTIEGNIFLNASQGVLINGGRDNRVEHNLFLQVGNMMRGTDLTEAYVTWGHASWTTLNANLRATPIDSQPWREAYPELVDILEDEPQLPRRNVIRENLLFRTPSEFGKKGLQEVFVVEGTVTGNVETDVSPGDFDSDLERFVFSASSDAFERIPALRSIPVEQIGRR